MHHFSSSHFAVLLLLMCYHAVELSELHREESRESCIEQRKCLNAFKQLLLSEKHAAQQLKG